MPKSILAKIDDAAKQYNKTKDIKYKNLWYKLIKEFSELCPLNQKNK